jgi:alpha-tubulin suppressor-like RCC1 family protein
MNGRNGVRVGRWLGMLVHVLAAALVAGACSHTSNLGDDAPSASGGDGAASSGGDGDGTPASGQPSVAGGKGGSGGVHAEVGGEAGTAGVTMAGGMGGACEPGASAGDPLKMVILHNGGCLARHGTVWCWGAWSGQDDLPWPERYLPAPMPRLDHIVDLAAGFDHVCALDEDGHVFCWGDNQEGQAGPIAGGGVCTDGEGETSPCETKPKRVRAIEGAVQLALGYSTSCARLGDGSVKCWGLATEGSTWLESRAVPEVFALGLKACVAEADGTVACSGAPEDVPSGLADITQLSMSVYHDLTCALSAQGTVTCWGDNSAGGLGVGNFEPAPLPFGQPAILSGAVGISARGGHVCALLGSGGVTCWGANSAGELGHGSPQCQPLGQRDPVPCATEPGPLPGPISARLVEVGEHGTCVALADAAVWCWGYASAGSSSQPNFVPGFWQDASADEVATRRAAYVAIGEAVALAGETSCRTGADCREPVSPGVSCYPACQGQPRIESSTDSLTEALDQLDAEICAGFEASGCSTGLECPEVNLIVDCTPKGAGGGRASQCVAFDPVAAGCTNACECESLARGAYYGFPSGCAGSDLVLGALSECSDCPRGFLVRVANAGAAAFDGNVTIETDDSTILATLPLTLEPDGLSAPIRLEPSGGTRIRVVASDDCDTDSELLIVPPPDWCQP